LSLHVFTLKHEGQKHKVALDLLEPAKPELKALNPSYRVACTAYRQNAGDGKLAAQGLTLKGEIPVKELVRWARSKGFLAWEGSASKPQPALQPAS